RISTLAAKLSKRAGNSGHVCASLGVRGCSGEFEADAHSASKLPGGFRKCSWGGIRPPVFKWATGGVESSRSFLSTERGGAKLVFSGQFIGGGIIRRKTCFHRIFRV